MKVRSLNKLVFKAGREGTSSAIIEIEQIVSNRDTVRQLYHITTTDYAVLENGQGEELPLFQNREYLNSRTIVKSYKDFDAEIQEFKDSDTSGISGSELQDKAMQSILLASVIDLNLYTSIEWEAVV
jgi:hypothetical protein